MADHSTVLKSMFETQGFRWNYRYIIPKELYTVLNHNLNESSSQSPVYQSYIKFLKSLRTITEIPADYYLILQKLFLDIQAYDLLVEAKKYDIKMYDVKVVSKTLAVKLTEQHHSIVEENDSVALKYDGCTCYCKVHAITGSNKTNKIMYIEPSNKKANKWPHRSEAINITIRFLPSYWSVNASLHALHILSAYDVRNVLYPKLQTTPYHLSKQIFKWNQTAIEDDPEQQQAIISILNQTSKPAPYILFGPPGTGKTTTLVEIILQIWQQDASKYVLVLAGSNTAVDEIAKRLIAKNVIPSKYIYRMYSSRKKSEDIYETIQPSANFYKEKTIFLPQEFLYLKHVILTTIASSARLLTLNLPKDHFSFIIIDEASQCQESEVLSPYALSCVKDQWGKTITHAQMVFCGDPYQLGPVVHSEIVKHMLEKSVLERLMQYEPYQLINNKYNPQYITRLRRNYRSRAPIIHLPSRMFYKGALKACIDFDERKWKLKWPELKNQKFPIVFCAVNGQEQPLQPLKSVYNKNEIDITIRYVKKLLNKKFSSYELSEDDIGIVTPFTAQKIMMEKALFGKQLKKIVVGTVDLFQGQEKPVMIISTVRSSVFKYNEDSHIGFLSHAKRFNVALTRAKIFVLVIGNPEVLCTNKRWKELWEYCAENDACIDLRTSNVDKENAPLKAVL